MTVRLPGPKFGARDVLSRADLKIIFEKGPIHSGCKTRYYHMMPGKEIIRDHHFWIPLVGLFSGLRLNEIVTLRPDELIDKEGVPCFEITETDIRKLKTTWSERLVPVHPELIRIGLLDYRDEVCRCGSANLWPELRPNRDGLYTENFSHFWTTYRRKLGITSDKKPFYSFRHTFIAGLKARHRPGGGHLRVGGAFHGRRTTPPLRQALAALSAGAGDRKAGFRDRSVAPAPAVRRGGYL